MSQSPSTSEQKTNTSPAGGEPADFPEIKPAQNVKTGNLADTNSDEYKHKHGEHHHHHHHHRHHHRHFHLFSLSPSGIRDNLKLIFTSVFTYPYMLLFLALAFLFIMKSGIMRALLKACKGSFPTAELFYRWQEFLLMKESVMIRIPFLFTLLVSVGITLVLMYRQERHWQRNVMKLLPALGATAVFAFAPYGSQSSNENDARNACHDALINYHRYCIEYALTHDDNFPNKLPEKASMGLRFGADHYEYLGDGKSAKDEPFILLKDKKENHVGDYRRAITSDGRILVSRYGSQDFRIEKDSAAQAAE